MKKYEYITIVNEKINNKETRNIFNNQIEKYYEISNSFVLKKHNYKKGDEVLLPKGTILHGTYKNLEGLQGIANGGLISSWFIDGRMTKYPSSVGVWNLKKNYKLKDYINFYSGATIMYCGVFENNIDTQKNYTKVIPYNKLSNIIDIITKYDSHMWTMEQTKEARFMPSLVQNRVQIGIIFNGESDEMKQLLKGDILNPNMINDEDIKDFVHPDYYNNFIIDRKNKNDFFTDRESAVIFGLPPCFIEGIIVGRDYEKDDEILMSIKELLPNAYICNLDGIVIHE